MAFGVIFDLHSSFIPLFYVVYVCIVFDVGAFAIMCYINILTLTTVSRL